VKLDLQNVLWRTRGRHWDYTFVLQPASPLLDSWYDIHVKVFAGLTPGNSPVTRGGVLSYGDERCPYLATTFRDSERLDVAGRPVAHYLVCFPSVEVDDSRLLNIPKDWGEQIVLAFGGAFNMTFDLSPSELQDSETESIERVFANTRDQNNEFILAGPAVPASLDTDVMAVVPIAKTNAAEPAVGYFSLDRVASLRRSIESAIVEGEAYALGFKGNFGTFSVLVSKIHDSALPQLLAESFDGAITDQFIKARSKGIRSRVLKTSLPPNPRRGGDSIVATLQRFPFDSAAQPEAHKRAIAKLLGADMDDHVVRSVLARLG
jgi:hypothetical protein